jgi:hypothetical protein
MRLEGIWDVGLLWAVGRTVVGCAVVGCAAVGCTADPDLPPGLLGSAALPDAGSSAAPGGPSFSLGSTQGYARGPYGNADGDVIQNFCFNFVWQDPKAANYDTRGMHRWCMADAYDPDGSKGIRVLLLTTAAEWCSECRNEWSGSSEFVPFAPEIKRRQVDGLRSLGLIYQDEGAKPATTLNAVNWARAYQIDVPFGLDSDFAMGAFAQANSQPFNMLVRTDTMQIIGRFPGVQPGNVFARIDQELSKPWPNADASTGDAGTGDAGTGNAGAAGSGAAAVADADADRDR